MNFVSRAQRFVPAGLFAAGLLAAAPSSVSLAATFANELMLICLLYTSPSPRD